MKIKAEQLIWSSIDSRGYTVVALSEGARQFINTVEAHAGFFGEIAKEDFRGSYQVYYKNNYILAAKTWIQGQDSSGRPTLNYHCYIIDKDDFDKYIYADAFNLIELLRFKTYSGKEKLEPVVLETDGCLNPEFNEIDFIESIIPITLEIADNIILDKKIIISYSRPIDDIIKYSYRFINKYLFKKKISFSTLSFSPKCLYDIMVIPQSHINYDWLEEKIPDKFHIMQIRNKPYNPCSDQLKFINRWIIDKDSKSLLKFKKLYRQTNNLQEIKERIEYESKISSEKSSIDKLSIALQSGIKDIILKEIDEIEKNKTKFFDELITSQEKHRILKGLYNQDPDTVHKFIVYWAEKFIERKTEIFNNESLDLVKIISGYKIENPELIINVLNTIIFINPNLIKEQEYLEKIKDCIYIIFKPVNSMQKKKIDLFLVSDKNLQILLKNKHLPSDEYIANYIIDNFLQKTNNNNVKISYIIEKIFISFFVEDINFVEIFYKKLIDKNLYLELPESLKYRINKINLQKFYKAYIFNEKKPYQIDWTALRKYIYPIVDIAEWKQFIDEIDNKIKENLGNKYKNNTDYQEWKSEYKKSFKKIKINKEYILYSAIFIFCIVFLIFSYLIIKIISAPKEKIGKIKVQEQIVENKNQLTEKKNYDINKLPLGSNVHKKPVKPKIPKKHYTSHNKKKKYSSSTSASSNSLETEIAKKENILKTNPGKKENKKFMDELIDLYLSNNQIQNAEIYVNNESQIEYKKYFAGKINMYKGKNEQAYNDFKESANSFKDVIKNNQKEKPMITKIDDLIKKNFKKWANKEKEDKKINIYKEAVDFFADKQNYKNDFIRLGNQELYSLVEKYTKSNEYSKTLELLNKKEYKIFINDEKKYKKTKENILLAGVLHNLKTGNYNRVSEFYNKMEKEYKIYKDNALKLADEFFIKGDKKLEGIAYNIYSQNINNKIEHYEYYLHLLYKNDKISAKEEIKKILSNKQKYNEITQTVAQALYAKPFLEAKFSEKLEDQYLSDEYKRLIKYAQRKKINDEWISKNKYKKISDLGKSDILFKFNDGKIRFVSRTWDKNNILDYYKIFYDFKERKQKNNLQPLNKYSIFYAEEGISPFKTKNIYILTLDGTDIDKSIIDTSRVHYDKEIPENSSRLKIQNIKQDEKGVYISINGKKIEIFSPEKSKK